MTDYKQKYLKYKSKYLKLKAEEIQHGSAIDVKSKFIGFFLSDSQLEIAKKAWVSQRKKISFFKSIDPGDFVLHFDDFVKLKGINHKSYFVNFAEPAKQGKKAKLAMTTIEETYAWNDKQFPMSIDITSEFGNFNLDNSKLDRNLLQQILMKIRQTMSSISNSNLPPTIGYSQIEQTVNPYNVPPTIEKSKKSQSKSYSFLPPQFRPSAPPEQQFGGIAKADIEKQKIESLFPRHVLLVQIKGVGTNRVTGLFSLNKKNELHPNQSYISLGTHDPDTTNFDYDTVLGHTSRGISKAAAVVSDTATGLYSPLDTTRNLKNLEKFVRQLKVSDEHLQIIYGIKDNKLDSKETQKIFDQIISQDVYAKKK